MYSFYRSLILLFSIAAAIAFTYFLLSPVLMLPVDPAFAKLTTGKLTTHVDGETWVPIHGLHLVLQYTALVNSLLFILMVFTSTVVLILAPLITFMRHKFILTVLGIASMVNFAGAIAVMMIFSPYIETLTMASACCAMLLILVAIYMRHDLLPTVDDKQARQ